MSICKNCGSKIEDGKAYCPYCGEPIKEGTEQENTQKNQYVSKVILEEKPKNFSKQTKRSKKFWITAIIALIILIIIVLILALGGQQKEGSAGNSKLKPRPTPKKITNNELYGENYKHYGTVGKLNEPTIFISIYASDSDNKWDFNKNEDVKRRDTSMKRFGRATDWIKDQANRYSANTDFYYNWKDDSALYQEMFIDAKGDHSDAETAAISKLKKKTLALTKKYKTKSVGYVFFYNTPKDSDDYSYTSARTAGESEEEYEYEYDYLSVYTGNEGDEKTSASYAQMILYTFGAPSMSEASSAIPQAFVDHLEETDSDDIMYGYMFDTGDRLKIDSEFTELDAYYTGLTNHSDTRDKWKLAKSIYEDIPNREKK